MGIDEGSQSSAHVRVQAAKSLAAEVEMSGQKVKKRLEYAAEHHRSGRMESSWLDSGSSQESCSGGTRSSRPTMRSHAGGADGPWTL